MDNDGIIKIIIGIGIGFVAAVIIFKKETTTQAATQTQIEQRQSPLFGWKPLSDIPSIDKLDQFKPIPVENVEYQEIQSGTMYKNSEKWKIVRNENNRIIGYELDRNAKIE